MGSAINERPMCPTFKHRMALLRISPGRRGFEDRTFECSTCGRTKKVSLRRPLQYECCGMARQRASAAALTLF